MHPRFFGRSAAKKIRRPDCGIPDVGGVVRARALAKQLGCDLAIIDKRRPKANVIGSDARHRRNRRAQLRHHGRHD
jgi:phosphoribosylpyrophosphate synthetase